MASAPNDRHQTLMVWVTIAGIVEIAVGLLHFAMPVFWKRSPGLASLDGAETDFVTLVTFATGILLVAFGVVTIGAARSPSVPASVLGGYLLVKAVLWSSRLVLEVLYPVGLEMFAIDPFTFVVLPGVAIMTVLFVVTAWRVRSLSSGADHLSGSAD